MSAGPLRIADFRHRVSICSMNDVVDNNGTMQLIRKDVYQCWAKIYGVRGYQQSKAGYTVKENLNYRTHVVAIRYRRDIDMTTAAWIYEERRQSPPRWFKIVNSVDGDDNSEFLEIEARLVENSPDAVSPVADVLKTLGAIPLAKGVKL